MKMAIFRKIFENHSNIKFYEHLSNGHRVVPCGLAGGRTAGQTDRRTNGQADMTLMVDIRNFASAP
jgi:hypothetical protein